MKTNMYVSLVFFFRKNRVTNQPTNTILPSLESLFLLRIQVNQMLFDGLTVLQHRGQDAAGIVTADRQRLHLRKDNGLVKDVFHQHHMLELRGNLGLGHCRYPTAGSSSCAEAQPLYSNYPYGICVVHNGNLTNTVELAKVVKSQLVSAFPESIKLCSSCISLCLLIIRLF
jgi:glutamine phosphoribosylpyrophosphate amidotransferase